MNAPGEERATDSQLEHHKRCRCVDTNHVIAWTNWKLVQAEKELMCKDDLTRVARADSDALPKRLREVEGERDGFEIDLLNEGAWHERCLESERKLAQAEQRVATLLHDYNAMMVRYEAQVAEQTAQIHADWQRVAGVEVALTRLVAELSDLQIQAVREGCGNTNAAVLHLRVHEAKAALGALTPPPPVSKEPQP